MADIRVAQTGNDANTVTGTQSFTATGFGTPKAAIFIVTNATAPNTDATHAVFSVGITDGTNQRVASMWFESGVSTSDSGRVRSDAAVIRATNGQNGTITFEANFNAWVTDGVEIDITNPPPAGWLVTVILFGGDDLQATVGNLATSATIGGTNSVSGLGYEPDQVFAIYAQNNFTPASNADAYFGMGWADNGSSIEQRSWTAGWVDNVGAVGNVRFCASLSYEEIARRLQATGVGAPDLRASYELTSFDSGGFTVTTRDGAAGANFGYLALSYGGGGHWLGEVQQPLSTGSQATTGLGFRPQALLAIGQGSASASTFAAQGPGTGQFSFCGACDFGPGGSGSDDSRSSAIYNDWDVATSDAGSHVTLDALLIRDDTGDESAASFTSWDSDGFTLNWTDLFVRQAIFLCVAIEQRTISRRADEGANVEGDPRRLNLFARDLLEAANLVDATRLARLIRRVANEGANLPDDTRRAVLYVRESAESASLPDDTRAALVRVREALESVNTEEDARRAIEAVREALESASLTEDTRYALVTLLNAIVRESAEPINVGATTYPVVMVVAAIQAALRLWTSASTGGAVQDTSPSGPSPSLTVSGPGRRPVQDTRKPRA